MAAEGKRMAMLVGLKSVNWKELQDPRSIWASLFYYFASFPPFPYLLTLLNWTLVLESLS